MLDIVIVAIIALIAAVVVVFLILLAINVAIVVKLRSIIPPSSPATPPAARYPVPGSRNAADNYPAARPLA